MEGTTGKCHYRPLYHAVRVEQQMVSIIDLEEAQRRGQDFLAMARELMHSSSSQTPQTQCQITEYLLDATDLGCAEAPYIMALRMLAGETSNAFLHDDVILFLKLAAERGQHDACYRMACCYQGRHLFPDILRVGEAYFASLAQEERELLADYYFRLATHP